MTLMTSAASIPEGEVLDTPSCQSSSNTKTMNSKAQPSSESKSSSDLQKTRVTACSKLMEEAKCIGEAPEALCPVLDSIIDLFLINIWKDKAIFAKWELLFADIDNCTSWLPKSRSDINLWLQSSPGQDSVFQVVLRTIFLTQFYSNGFFE